MASRAALHERIVAAEGAQAVEVGIDLRRLNEPDSPVFNRAENSAPFFVAMGSVFRGALFRRLDLGAGGRRDRAQS